MVIRLTPQLEARVEEMLKTGHYSDSEEVIDTALKLLGKRLQQIALLDAAFTAAEHQVAEGRTIPYTPQLMERLKREATENARLKKPIDNDLIF